MFTENVEPAFIPENTPSGASMDVRQRKLKLRHTQDDDSHGNPSPDSSFPRLRVNEAEGVMPLNRPMGRALAALPRVSEKSEATLKFANVSAAI